MQSFAKNSILIFSVADLKGGIMKKKIIAVLSLIFCLSLFLFACDNSASAEIELDGFKAPTYGDTYYVGEEITLKKLTVEEGETFTVSDFIIG